MILSHIFDKARLFWLTSLLLFFLTSPPLHAKNRYDQIRTEADLALHHQQLGKAKELYNKMWEQSQKRKESADVQGEFAANYANVLIRLGNLKTAKEVLNKALDQKKLGKEPLRKCTLLLARIYDRQKDPGESFILMQGLSNGIPQNQWNAEERVFYSSIKQKVDQQLFDTLESAARLFKTGLFLESTVLYQEVFDAMVAGKFPSAYETTGDAAFTAHHLTYRLAEAYFLAGRFDLVIDTMEKFPPLPIEKSEVAAKIRQDGLYLQGLAYRKAGLYEKAVEIFRKRRAMEFPHNPDLYDELEWEIAVAYFKANNFEKSRSLFEALASSSSNHSTAALSDLYLARINIAEGSHDIAYIILDELAEELHEEDPIQDEIIFCLGEISYYKRDFPSAIECYQKSLTVKDLMLLDWQKEALEHLGWSYFHLGTDQNLSQHQQKICLQRAEKSFSELSTIPYWESASVALAKVYIAQWKLLKDESAKNALTTLFHSARHKHSINAEIEVGLLLAEACDSFEERHKLYRSFTEKKYEQTAAYPDIWMVRGLSEYEQGLATGDDALFATAIESLNEAFTRFQTTDKQKAGEVIRLQAEVYHHLPGEDAQWIAFSLLNSLVSQYIEMMAEMRDPDHIHYLLGKIGQGLSPKYKTLDVAEVIRNALLKVTTSYPESSLVPKCHALLAQHHMERGEYNHAETALQALTQCYETADEKEGALVQLIECGVALGKSPSFLRKWRSKLIREFPDNPLVPACYLELHSEDTYLSGSKTNHLRTMVKLFPNAPATLKAHYLLSEIAPKNNYREKLLALEPLINLENLYQSIEKPCEKDTHLRTHATLKLASRYLELAEVAPVQEKGTWIQEAEIAYRDLVRDLENGPKLLLEECQFALLVHLIHIGQDEEASDLIDTMIGSYQKQRSRQARFLPDLYLKKALLTAIEGNTKRAQKLISQSEKAGKATNDRKAEAELILAHAHLANKKPNKAGPHLKKALQVAVDPSLRTEISRMMKLM